MVGIVSYNWAYYLGFLVCCIGVLYRRFERRGPPGGGPTRALP